MPLKNTIREDADEMYYHVYARGNSKQPVFLDEEDYSVFLNLLKRYMSEEVVKDKSGREYANYYAAVELLTFCVLPNHFHMLIYQRDAGVLMQLMKSIMTAYAMYFNKKYGRLGPLFESRYKASRISNDLYLQHISRYIHLNPEKWEDWPWSSLPYYRGEYSASWIRPGRVLELFDGSYEKYHEFLADYGDYRAYLESLKRELAD